MFHSRKHQRVGMSSSADESRMTPVANEPSAPEARLRAATAAVRSQVLDLLRDAANLGMARDSSAHEVVARLQRASNDLGEALRSLPESGPGAQRDQLEGMEPAPSRDAAVVLTLGSLTVPAGATGVDKAERWLRILRLYGRVGAALLRLGVPEGPVATVAEPATKPEESGQPRSEEKVARCAADLARSAGAATVDTVHVLFAVHEVFGAGLDRALYHRGTTWDELVESLASPSPRSHA